MSSREKEQTIALSAVFQAAELVSILAKTGQVDNASLQPMLDSILMVNAASTEDVYGGQWDCQSNLALGRKISRQALGKERSSVNPDTLRYALSLIHLEHKLSKAPNMLPLIGQKIAQIEQKKAHYDSVLHENMLASISGMYQDTLSKLSFSYSSTWRQSVLTAATGGQSSSSHPNVWYSSRDVMATTWW